MKKKVFTVIFLVFAFSLTAQNNLAGEQLKAINNQPSSRLTTNRTFQKFKPDDLRKEIDEIKTARLLNETVLDSVVHYRFLTESDSILKSKMEYKWYETGNPKTWLGYIWKNGQWVYSEKTDFTFDEDGHITSQNMFLWDTIQNNWVNYKQMNNTYDENGYDELFTYLKWNTELERWDKYYKELSDYNENGNLLELTIWNGNENNNWEYYYKEVNTYNTNGTLNNSYIAFWNTDSNDWLNYQKEEYFYFDSGLVNYRLYYLWLTDAWELQFKTDYYYTATEELDSLVTYVWQSDEWTLYGKNEYSYDENDNLLLRLQLLWNVDHWVNHVKTELAYDENNNQTLYVRSTWDANKKGWVFQSKFENLYDTSNHLIMTSNYWWSTDSGHWIGLSLNEFVYDENGERSIDISYQWDDVALDWVLDEKAFYYRSVITRIPGLESNDFLVYPNPVESNLFIKNQGSQVVSCTLVSVSGRKVMQFDIHGTDARINLENLPEGIYFLQIKKDSKTTVKKIIKR